ncbi:MAG: tetraacyldisaccharide 4'-kinase [Chitinophagales bacterium]|nr:tetraacyldisaccharide 4'-kinase [Chitinophagales bacterium]
MFFFYFKFLIAHIIDLALKIRDFAYQRNILKAKSTELKTISIGNLALGGQGKSSMVGFLVTYLSQTYHIAILMRGYRRAISGIGHVLSHHTAREVGDEAKMHALSYSVPVVFASDRHQGIAYIQQNFPTVDLVLLDDAMQHKSLVPNCQLLLSDIDKPFYLDELWPLGNLRDRKQNAQLADIIIYTKTNNQVNYSKISMNTKAIYPEIPIYFASTEYIPIEIPNDTKIMSISGLANNTEFFTYITQNFPKSIHLSFPNHYDYQIKDIEGIVKECIQKQIANILTTSKDYVKLMFYANEFQKAKFNFLLELFVYMFFVYLYFCRVK